MQSDVYLIPPNTTSIQSKEAGRVILSRPFANTSYCSMPFFRPPM